jgi:hypothetical protein
MPGAIITKSFEIKEYVTSGKFVSIKFNKKPKSFWELSDPNSLSFSYDKIEITNSLTGDMYI